MNKTKTLSHTANERTNEKKTKIYMRRLLNVMSWAIHLTFPLLWVCVSVVSLSVFVSFTLVAIFTMEKKMVRERRRRIFVLFLVFSAPVFLFFFCCVFVFRAKLSMCICLCGGMDKQLYAINGPDLIDNQNYEGNFLWTWSDPNSTVSCLITSFIQQKTGNNKHIK